MASITQDPKLRRELVSEVARGNEPWGLLYWVGWLGLALLPLLILGGTAFAVRCLD